MSLTETVFQLIESDVSQTNDALDNLRRSADDIFDDIKTHSKIRCRSAAC